MIEPVPTATASPLVRRYTLEEFLALGAPPQGGHYELIAGVLYMVPSPAWPHNLAASRLNLALARYAAAHPDRCILFIPATPIWTPADTYLVPDLFLISAERLRGMDGERITSAELVVEILSPSTAVYDRTAKADTYAALGVDELWLVDLATRAIERRQLAGTVFRAADTFSGTQPVESLAFAGLAVVPDDVFR